MITLRTDDFDMEGSYQIDWLPVRDERGLVEGMVAVKTVGLEGEIPFDRVTLSKEDIIHLHKTAMQRQEEEDVADKIALGEACAERQYRNDDESLKD